MNEPTQNDGGPAFPCLPPDPNPSAYLQFPSSIGMTIRDYFAAQALTNAALFTYSGRMEGEESGEWADWPDHAKLLSINAYSIADAMLKARAAK